jgi:hypothetical protein
LLGCSNCIKNFIHAMHIMFNGCWVFLGRTLSIVKWCFFSQCCNGF